MTSRIHRVNIEDDLAAIAASVIGSEWGKDNELKDYSESALHDIVREPNTILLIAYMDKKPAGLALAMKLLEPTGEYWLYIDQIDVHSDYRRQGIGRQLMERLFDYAREWRLPEVWVGTEPDNAPANQLYKSLQPSETEDFVGYTYKIDGKK